VRGAHFPQPEAVAGALRALGARDAAEWAPVLSAACLRHGITDAADVACFLANCSHETGRFRTLVESLNYAADRLCVVFGAHRITPAQAARYGRTSRQPADERAIANIVYGGDWGRRNLGNTQPEDGFYFRGKGLIQLTGRANHTRFARAIGVDVVRLQALLETKQGAADAAAHFWAAQGCGACARCGDVAGARRIVNGGSLGLREVEEGTRAALAALRPWVP
jgi:putative chitinase